MSKCRFDLSKDCNNTDCFNCVLDKTGMIVEFHHGALCDTYEDQANAQGFTFGDKADWIEKVGYGLICAHIHGCITDAEYDKILHRFQTKILLKNLKPQESETES